MAPMRAKPKPSSINPSTTPPSTVDIAPYGKDMDNWPRSWMGLDQDLPPGEQLLPYFRLFIAHLATSNLAPRTIRRHVDNLWLLGGEIIRDLHYDPSLRKRPIERLLRSVIHEDGGPLIHNGS